MNKLTFYCVFTEDRHRGFLVNAESEREAIEIAESERGFENMFAYRVDIYPKDCIDMENVFTQ